MKRDALRRLVGLFLLALCFAPLTACVSPFSEHSKDHQAVFQRDWNEAHRKYDRYFLNLDWDDPYHDWVDESYATGPMHSRYR